MDEAPCSVQVLTSLAAVLLASCSIAGCGSTESIDVVERFDGNKFDRSHWQLATPNAAVGTVEIRDDALVMTAPPASKPRPQINNTGKFRFEGDFDVSMKFTLLTEIPEPEKDYINLEVILYGADGTAHFSRVNHKGSGNGVVAYFAPSVTPQKSVWKHSRTEAGSGTLKLARVGESVDFLFLPENSNDPVLVASAPFGSGLVRNMSVALSVASPTTRALKVRVDDIEVHSRPRVPSFLTSSVLWLTIVLLLGLVGSGIWLWRAGKFG